VDLPCEFAVHDNKVFYARNRYVKEFEDYSEILFTIKHILLVPVFTISNWQEIRTSKINTSLTSTFWFQKKYDPKLNGCNFQVIMNGLCGK